MISESLNELLEQLDPQKIRAEIARRNLLDFIIFTKPDYEVNWHHRVLCEYAERWAFGDIDRLMVFMPPRSGKSEIVSRRLPAYVFGKNPNASIIAASYAADLAARMNRDVQRIIDDDRYKSLFPNTTLWGAQVRTVAEGTYLRNSDIFEIVGHSGVYRGSGIGGGITGMGFTHGIIDDPIKDREQADSEAYREKLWDWYISTFYTRRANDAAKILITLTRWHSDDLVGRLLKQEEFADKWTIISFPMIAEDPISVHDPRKVGEALWPSKFSLENLEKTKAVMLSYDWAALMQQRPTLREGARIKRAWLKYVDAIPPKSYITMGVDLAISEKTTADYTAIGVLARDSEGRIYVVDVARIRGSFQDQLNFIKSMATKWQPRIVGVEDVAYQRVMVQQLSRETTLNVRAYKPDRDKVARFSPLEARYERGEVYHLRGLSNAFEAELLSFPLSEHDDQVDSLSIAFSMLGFANNAPISEIYSDGWNAPEGYSETRISIDDVI